MESAASKIRGYDAQRVPGLLQTAEYAQAILAVDPETTEDKLGELVAARMERQAILDKPNPPTLWVVFENEPVISGISCVTFTSASSLFMVINEGVEMMLLLPSLRSA